MAKGLYSSYTITYSMMKTIKIKARTWVNDSNNQMLVTIPLEAREKYNIERHDLVGIIPLEETEPKPKTLKGG
jgi:vacuolar-type H+-ATPase subunit F/Vma7